MCSLDCNDSLGWTWSEWEMKTISSQCKHCRRRWKWRENRRRNHEAFPRLGHSHILTITNILLNGITKPQLRKHPDICILWQLWGEMTKGAMRTFSQESGKLQLPEHWTCWAIVEEISAALFFFCGGLWCGTWQKGGCNGQSHDQPIIQGGKKSGEAPPW